MTAPRMASPSTLVPVTVTRPESRSISTLRTPGTSASSSRTESTQCEHVIPATMYTAGLGRFGHQQSVYGWGVSLVNVPNRMEPVKYHPWVYTPTTHLALTSDPPV